MANVSPVGDTPDDEFVSRAETAAQLAEEAALLAQQAAADAQAAAAAAQAAVAAQRFQDHADSDPAWPLEAVGNYLRYGASGWTHEAFNQALNDLVDVDVGGAADGTSIIKTGGVYIPFTPVNPADFLLLAGGTMTGALELAGAPSTALEAATKAYVDGQFATQSPYDIGIFFEGIPAADQVLYRLNVPRGLSLPLNLTGSVADANVGATAAYSIDIRKNGVSIGSVDWAAAASTATFTFAAEVTFVSGDTLELVAPSTPDGTLENISVTLAAVVQ